MKKIFHNPSEEQVNLSTDNDLDEGSLGARLQAMLSQAGPAVQEKQGIPLDKGSNKLSPLRLVQGMPSLAPPPTQEEQVNHNSVDHIDEQGPPGPVPVQEMFSQMTPPFQEDQENLRIVEHLDMQSLPDLVREMLSLASNPDERDILLASMITAVSACIPHFYFCYGLTAKRYYANLQLFVIAGPASGKGIAGLAQRMVKVVEKQFRLSIPGDSTYPAWFKRLHKQKGCGFMFESEGSVITDIWKASTFTYNTALRKVAEHEMISRARVNAPDLDIETPKVSMLLTGTFGQYKALVPNVENGYFSRLQTLIITGVHPFDKRYVTADSKKSDIPEKIGNYLLNLYAATSKDGERKWDLKVWQKEHLGSQYEKMDKTLMSMLGDGIHSAVVRMPIQIKRIALVLSVLRGNFKECSDEDFMTALTIGNILMQHMVMAFKLIDGEHQRIIPDIKPLDSKQIIFDQLPTEYETKELINIAKAIGLSESTAHRYNEEWITLNLVTKTRHGKYKKVVTV